MTNQNGTVSNSDALLEWLSRTSGDIRIVQKELDGLRKWVQRETDKVGDLASKKGVKPTPLEYDLNAVKQRQKQVEMLKSTSKLDHKPHKVDSFQPNETYVYVVPHTHTDLGWLETVEDYYSKCS